MKRILSIALSVILSISSVCYGTVIFDGTDDYLNIGKAGDICSTLGGNWTFSFWAKNSSTSVVAICGSFDDGTTQGFILLFNQDYLGNSDAGKVRVYIRDDDSNAFNAGFTNDQSEVTDGAWHHYVVCRSSNVISMYIDNNSIALSTSGTLANVDNFDTEFQYILPIGANNDRGTPQLFFPGPMTEFCYWGGIALTATEIALLANSKIKRMPLQIQSSYLKLYLPLDDHPHNDTANSANGLTFKDISGNGNDGTANGCNAQAEEVLSYPSWAEYIHSFSEAGGYTGWVTVIRT